MGLHRRGSIFLFYIRASHWATSYYATTHNRSGATVWAEIISHYPSGRRRQKWRAGEAAADLARPTRSLAYVLREFHVRAKCKPG